MLVPWLAGFVAYQMINPGYIGWWSTHVAARQRLRSAFTPASWMSASMLSFVVAASLPFRSVLSRRNLRADPSRGR